MLRNHRHKRIVKRTVKIAIHNHFGSKATPSSRETAKEQSTRNRPESTPEAEAGNRNEGHREHDGRHGAKAKGPGSQPGQSGQPDPGLETYDGKSRIVLILAVEKATDYDHTDPCCPSCGQEKGEMVVFLVAGGDGGRVCRACPACFVGFGKRA